MLGQEIRTLVNKLQSKGIKTVQWDGKNNAGKLVPSGVYIYHIQADISDSKSHSKKMIILK